MKKTGVTIFESNGNVELGSSVRTVVVDCESFEEMTNISTTIENAFKYEQTLVLSNSDSICVEEIFRIFQIASRSLVDTVFVCSDSTLIPTLCIQSFAKANKMNFKLTKNKTAAR